MKIIKTILKKLCYETPRRLVNYIAWTGVVTGTYLLLLQFFRIKRRVAITIGGHSLTVRSASPDIVVAASSLVYQEYQDIRHDQPKLIIDAGANIGTSAIWFASRFPEAKIIAIEPEAENFELLQENVRQFPNIHPLCAAIWNEPGSRPLVNRNTGEWGYTLVESADSSSSMGQEIPCVTIESLMEEHDVKTVDILKMDIEGGEKAVLESSESWIDKVQVITVELHDRIIMGCDRAFYLATKDFGHFERHGEKVTAYRSIPGDSV